MGFRQYADRYPYDPRRQSSCWRQQGATRLKWNCSPTVHRAAITRLAPTLPLRCRAICKVGVEAEIRKLDIGAFLATVRSGVCGNVPDRVQR
jgi:hypothetical protein